MTQPSLLRRFGAPLLAVVASVAVGGAVGWAAGLRSGDPVVVASVRPIHAVSPSVPVFVPYSPDVEYPALQTHLSFVTRTIGEKPYLWRYAVPKGWVPTNLGINEIRWAPAGEPAGGYFLRVKLISSHLTPTQMVQQKYDALRACCQDVTLIQQQWNTLGVTYRAEFEMSVGGRSIDDPGLEDLMTRVSASVRKSG